MTIVIKNICHIIHTETHCPLFRTTMSELLQFKHTQFPEFISSGLRELFEARHGSSADLTILLDGDLSIPAHKSVLVLHSRYLQDLLLHHDSSQEDVQIILSGVSYQDMNAVLELVYLGQAFVDHQSLQDISSLSTLLGFKDVLSKPEHSQIKIEEKFYVKQEEDAFDTDIADPVEIKVIKKTKRTRMCHLCGKEFKGSNLKQRIEKHQKLGCMDQKVKVKKNESKRDREARERRNAKQIEKNNAETKVKPYNPLTTTRKVDLRDPELVRKAIEKLEEMREKMKKDKIKEESNSNVCDFCGSSYSSKKNLQQHIERIHLTERKCPHCDAKFKVVSRGQRDLKEYNNHITTCHPEYSFDCDICGKLFAFKGKVQTHKVQDHWNGVYRCDFCLTEFTKKGSFEIHLADVHGQRQKCDLCDYTAKTQGDVDDHKKEKHEGGVLRVQCTLCEKTFRDEWSMKTHVLYSHDKFRIECEFCDFKTPQISYLRDHILTVHGGATFPCSICGLEFSSRKQIQEHIKVDHNKEPPREERRKKFQCELCDWSTLKKKQVPIHMKNVHGEKKFECHECGKRFISQALLNQHGRVHSDETPYDCQACGRKFKYPQNLRIHKCNGIHSEGSKYSKHRTELQH